ncbi:hypothetical protein AUJ77_02620 [Candidatus Nomurabacteria bacterium CG1_02_43_90]|uniref:GP-PDE domain-containing protein n=1 Tax=Candidatus Nomurabacteria bacterium CG1_02_43_90 TaxID=1805281 RepID=A0A1J4V7C8_9BACT|nr:MAG: hypothetical protein AUJ77_02620 [Candidatus Nomurabacteria bacterium CG1_02_43_90]
MKIFAHRGWSAGENENTLLAFKNSANADLEGIEFDIRYSTDGQSVVVSHDPATSMHVLELEEALLFLSVTHLELLIEFKEYTPDLYVKVGEILRKYNLEERTTLFAFHSVAEKFPWENRGKVKLGIIAPYPHHIKKYIEAYHPDVVLFGWATKRERTLFKIIWSVCSLPRIFAKYPHVKFIIGVAFTKKDKVWLDTQTGLYCCTADFPLL